MKIQKEQILDFNKKGLENHNEDFDFLANKLTKKGHNVSEIASKLAEFQVAIPSWALGAGGTRFGRFSFYGEPLNLEQKIQDVGILHSLTQTAGAVSLHIPWDIPSDYTAIKEQADALNIKFDSVNSNTFQDQKNASESYKYGSLSNTSKAVRDQAIAHNLDVINIGNKLGSKSLTVWLADGSCFPGQNNFQTAFQNTQDSLKDIYKSRFLARQLAERDIKAQYRQSYLGVLWAFVTPLATAFVWIVLSNSGTVQLTDTGMPYPLFAFSGTLIWSIITASINSPLQSTNSARGIMTKINFPKEALIISGIYKLLFNTSIKLILLLIFLLFYGVGLHWSLLLVPLAVFGAVLFGTTIGLLITPMGLLYTDIKRLISFGMQFLMYVTPVVYVMPKTGILKTIMAWNPLTPIITTTRDLVFGAPLQSLTGFLIVILGCIPLLFIGLIIYRISIPIIVERLSA